MRFDDLIRRPAKKQKPLSYTESLQAKLASEMAVKPTPKFTALEWSIMEGGGSLEEAEASDAELRQRYGEFEPEDKPMLPTTQVGGAPAPTLWTTYDAIENILGRARVTDDEDAIEPGMYYVYQSSGPPMFRDTEELGPGGSINIPNLESKAARDVAMAVHEAYHAYVHDRTKGSGAVHSNEKIINNLAEKWLRAHLSGPALHVAIEAITGSRISYGANHIPMQKENFVSEDAMMGKIADSGKIIRILKKAHTVPFSDEKNWLLVDMDPAKGNKGLGIKWIPADTRFEWVRPYRDSIDENFNDDAEEYRAHLIKTLPKMMKLFANIGKGWIPSKEQMLNAVDTAYRVMKHTGDAKQAGKVLMDELNALYRMSQGKKSVDENFADGRNPQDKGDAKRHGVNTKASVSTLRKVAKQGGRKGQLAHWMANMKSGRNKKK
jgi:hypothetical protein